MATEFDFDRGEFSGYDRAESSVKNKGERFSTANNASFLWYGIIMSAHFRSEDPPPYFTIISVVLNDPAGLKLTAKSVLEQTKKNYGWIIVDGGSREPTIAALRSLSLKTVTIVSGVDQGIYDGMNRGIELALGRYLLFLNSGDSLRNSDTTRRLEEFIRDNRAPDIVFGGTNIDLGTGAIFYRPPRNPVRYIYHGMPAIHQSILISRAFLGSLRYNTNYSVCGDYDLIARLMSNQPRYRCYDEPISVFKIGGRSYRKFLLNIAEAAEIQKKLLDLPTWRIWISMMMRLRTKFLERLMYRVVPKRLVRKIVRLKPAR